MLNEGNQYEFSHLALELYPDVCEDAGFTFDDAVNNYKSRTDFSDGLYTLWSKNVSAGQTYKYFFDTNMNFKGTKAY